MFAHNGGVFIHQTTRNDVSKVCNLGLNSLTGLLGRSKRIIDWAEINDLHIKRLFYAFCTNTAGKCESDRPAGLQARYVPTVPSHFTTLKLNSFCYGHTFTTLAESGRKRINHLSLSGRDGHCVQFGYAIRRAASSSNNCWV